MANLPAPQFEEKRGRFDAEQQRLLETIADTNPEDVLEAAERIGVLIKGTKEKIEVVFESEKVSHELLFQRALAKERRKPGASEGAFGRAFEAVYGRFLFEQQTEDVKNPQSRLVRMLSKVLSNRIEAPDGTVDAAERKSLIALRSELQAVAKRLHMLDASATVKVGDREVKVADRLKEIEAEKASLESNIATINTGKKFIDAISSGISALGVTEGSALLIGQLEDLDQKATKTGDTLYKLRGEKKDKIDAKIRSGYRKVDAYFNSVHEMDTLLEEMNHSLEGLQFSSTERAFLVDFLQRFHELQARENFSFDDWQKFLDKELPGLVKNFNDLSVDRLSTDFLSQSKKFKDHVKYFTGKKNVKENKAAINGYEEALSDNEFNQTLINHYLGPNPQSVEEVRSKEELARIKELQLKHKEDLKTLFAGQRAAIEGFKTPQIEAATAGVAALCDGYLAKLAELEGKNPTDLTLAEIKAFVETHRAFLHDLKQLFDNASTAKGTELDSIRQQIAALEEETGKISELWGYKISIKMEKTKGEAEKPSDWVLEQALPGVKIEGDVVKIRGFETNFRHVAKILREAQVYFESPEEVPKVRDLYQNLVNLTGKTGERLSRTAASSLDDLMTKAGLDPAKSINSQLPKLRQQIQSKKDQKLSKPSSTDIRKGVEAKQRAHQQNPTLRNTPFDEAKATREVTDSYINSMAEVNDGLDEEISNLDQIRETLEEVMQKAKEFHEKMAKFVNNLEVAGKADVKIKKADGGRVDIAEIVGRFKKISLKSADFNVDDLMAIYYDLGGYFESDTNVSNFADSIRKAQEEIAKSTNLSDATAAKKLLGVMINEQNPDMPLPDQQKLASMILANDVATIQTEASYAELAKRGSAEKLDTVLQAGFKHKLIGFQYKEGDKTVAPFKGLKPEQFNDWAEIEQLFEIGRLNHQNGFFVLAAMKEFAPTADGQPIPQIQAVKLEKKLKTALAKELGVDERMDEAGIDKILNKAFADQMKRAQELVKAYFQHFDRNEGEWNGNKIKELNLRYAKVKEELKLGKINDATFGKRMAELIDEAKKGEVLDQVKFSEDSAMAGYWNSPFSQWFRDRGWDIGQYAKGKAKSVALSGVKLGAFGLWGATKLGLSATLQTALLPLRAVKYPLLLAAKPLIGVINLFRSQKWTPLPTIRETIRSDASRVASYFTTKGGETWKGAVGNVTGVPKTEWGKTPYAGKDYKARTKVDLPATEAQASELKAKGDPTPVEVAGSPFIDLKKYRDEIAKLDRILAQKPAEERGDSAADKRAA